jgi:hypothetical protein
MALLRHNELTIALPAGWREHSDVVAVVALERPEHDFRATMVVSRDRAGEDELAEAFAARQLPLLRGALRAYSLLSQGPLRAGGHDGFAREHTFITSGGGNVQQLQWYVVHDETAYTFTFTDLPVDFADSRAVAIKLLERVSFEEHASAS